MADMGTPLQEFLDRLGVPVLLMSEDTRIRSASASAASAVGKGPGSVVGGLPGEVFDCVYARLPGGCGRTVHCSGCALRLTVLDTFQTGRPHKAVPAMLKVEAAGKERDVAFLITTEKVGGRVLLRIDRRVD